MPPIEQPDFNPWVVQPETVNLDLEWRGRAFNVVIKKELNTGEDRALKGAAIHGMRGFAKPGEKVEDADPELLLNWKLAGYVRMEVYIVDWSLATEKGIKLKLPKDGAEGRAQFEALSSDLTMIIENAITAHVDKEEEANRPPVQVGSGSTLPESEPGKIIDVKPKVISA